MIGAPAGVLLGSGIPLTEQRIVTPLGIRCRAIALEGSITPGLPVFVKPHSLESRPLQLAPNPRGIFGSDDMPGVDTVEYPRVLDPPVWSPPAGLPFIVAV